MLIALERRKASALALLKACKISHAPITLPAPVLAEWWRGTHGSLLEIGRLEALTPQLGLRAGALLRETGKSNAVDAMVVASAEQRGDIVITGDIDDLKEIARGAAGVDVESID
jgi:hypothetical protein